MKKSSTHKIAAAAIFACCIFGANSVFAADEAAAAKAVAPVPAAQQKLVNPFDKLPDVLATIDGKNLTKADLLKMMEQQNISPEMFMNIPPAMVDNFLTRMIDDMISQQVFLE